MATEQWRRILVTACAGGGSADSELSGAGGNPSSFKSSVPFMSVIFMSRPTMPPARGGAIVTLTGVPGFNACSERARVQPLRISAAGFGSSSAPQCSTVPSAFFRSKKSCGCGFAKWKLVTVASRVHAFVRSYAISVP